MNDQSISRGLRAFALAAVTTAALLVPAAADAKVKTGTYTCTTNPGYAGTLRIHSQEKYSVNGGKKGKLVVKGKVLKFKTGDYKGVWKGKATSNVNIDLLYYGTNDFGMNCIR